METPTEERRNAGRPPLWREGRRVTHVLPEELAERLDAEARRCGAARSELLRRAIVLYLAAVAGDR